MARIRTIKPEFWKNEELAEISSDACLLAIGLLNYADDEGYFNANPALIKAEIFPIRKTSSIDTVLLPELSKLGYIELFLGSDNRKYGRVVNFLTHQVINKPRISKIKELCQVPYNYGNNTGELPLGKERKGKEYNINKKQKISLEELSTNHIFDWLKEKRNKGFYLNIDENEVLEVFKDYCLSKGVKYDDYVAAYRNAFKCEKFKQGNKNEANIRNNGQYQNTRKPTATDAINAVSEAIWRGEV